MAKKIWFNLITDANYLLDEDMLSELVESEELEVESIDDLRERLKSLIDKGAENCDGVPAFQAWFYNNLPDWWDYMVGTLNDAIHEYIYKNL